MAARVHLLRGGHAAAHVLLLRRHGLLAPLEGELVKVQLELAAVKVARVEVWERSRRRLHARGRTAKLARDVTSVRTGMKGLGVGAREGLGEMFVSKSDAVKGRR